jgi:dolichol kinase
MLAFARALLLTGLPIFILVTCTEYFWRKKNYHDEFTRKFMHITAGTYAAFWPWFISWGNIELLALGAFCALALSRAFNIFKSIHLTRRYDTGEFLAVAMVGLLAIVTHDKWIYAAALLEMSLADGLAALIGTYFGRNHRYHVLGHTKSIPGTITFFVVSFVILLLYSGHSGSHLVLASILALSFAATLLENFAIHGLDNLVVPLLVALVLAQVS